MKDKICATLTKDHIYICSGGVIGRSGENECTQLEITLDECLCDKWVYIDFVKPDGTTYKTSKLDIVNNKVVYDIPNALLDQKGTLKVQVVLQNEEGEIWKSNIKTYGVNPSINATDDIENKEDFITDAQRLLNEIEEGLTPTIGDNGNWFILDKDTGKTSIGPQGEKGDKGDAGAIKMQFLKELPETGKDDTLYFIAKDEPTEKDIYDEWAWVNKGTDEEPIWDWEHLGSPKVVIDLTDYVKKTDKANNNDLGLVKGGLNYGTNVAPSGVVAINPATDTEIQEKTQAYKPIVPTKIDYMFNNQMPTLTQDEYNKLVEAGTVDENLFYNIVEE